MPCRVDEHPSERFIYGMRHFQGDGCKLLDWIIGLSPRVMRFSEVYEKRSIIRRHLLFDAELKFAARGFWDGERTNAALVASAEHRRACKFYHAYKPLYEQLVIEMCALCKQSEKIPGKFLSTEQAAWWHHHKRSSGHEH